MPTPPLPNPLYEIHTQAQAEFQPYADLQIPSTFGQTPAEYAALRKSAALVDLPQRGLLELTGKDRHSFLNNLLTNQTWDKSTKTGLAAGAGVYAFFLNDKGRIRTDLNVLELGDRTLLELDARLVEPTRVAFEKYRFAEQVQFSNRIGQLHHLALHGPEALAILNRLATPPIPDLPQLGVATTTLLDHPAIVWRDDAIAAPGYNLIVPNDAARQIWMTMIAKFSVRSAGWAAFNAARIEGGRPIFGIDFDDTILPVETGQFARAVSLTKGCYLGQEVVARMHARQQIPRQLVGLRVAGDALPIAGARFFDDQSNEIGGVTSSTVSPLLSNAAICLGYLKKPFFALGTKVHVPAEGAMRQASVVATPFI